MMKIIDNIKEHISKCNYCNTYFIYEDKDVIHITSTGDMSGEYFYKETCIIIECPKCGTRYRVWNNDRKLFKTKEEMLEDD